MNMMPYSFQLPPISPLIGSTWSNFRKITQHHHIDRSQLLKYSLTGATILATTPFRLFDRLKFNKTSRQNIEKPIFIIGHWRSGTTFLHNLLCQEPEAAFLTTYQSVFPNFLASERVFGPVMDRFMPGMRPSDNMKLDRHYPQEDEYALSNVSSYSFYSFFYFPRAYNEIYERAVRFRGLSTHQVREMGKSYRILLGKALHSSKGDQMIVKNPVHTARINFLLSLYPDAKFIHIYRNPFNVFLSANKFFQLLIPELSFQKISSEGIKKMIIDLYSKIFSDYFSQRESVNEGSLVEIKFEDLERNPINVLGKIYEKLQLPCFDQAMPYYQSYLKTLQGYKKNTYTMSKADYQLVSDSWNDTLGRWGYSLPSNLEIIN